MTTSPTSYITAYFQYPNLTPIRGEPTNKALKRLKDELKANASSIECDFGGGDHGYLGLVLTDTEYATISVTPFICPVFPAPLAIPATATSVEAVHAREQRKESTRL